MSAAGTSKSLAVVCDPRSSKAQVEIAFAYLRSEIVLIRQIRALVGGNPVGSQGSYNPDAEDLAEHNTGKELDS